MQFTDNYEAICAFEVTSEQNKYFNIERISEVRWLDSNMFFEDKHEFFNPDVLGFQSTEMEKKVEFEMSLCLRLLLKEEYPLARAYIKAIPDGKGFIFKAKVQAYEGPERFVLGFWNDIEVIGSHEFSQYLKDKR